MRQHLLRQSAKNTRPEFGCTTARKPGNRTRLPRAHRNRSGHRGPAKAIRQAPEAMQPKSGGGNRRKGDRQPKIRCGTHRKTIDHQKPDEQKSLQRRSATKIRCRNRRKTIDHRKPDDKSRCKGNRQPKSNAEPTARQLTTGNRAGKVAARRLTAGNRSAETIDNRESGRRELPETAAARPLRRISRDGPRRRIPLPT